MAGFNWEQKFVTNPITSNLNDDLLYFARSPYGATDDAVINWQNFSSQFLLSATAATSGKILISNGSNWIASTSLWPNTVGTALHLLISDGTSNVYSTPAYPNASVTSGKLIISDGTNYIASTSIWPNTIGTAGQIVASNGTSNVYSTATFPLVGGAAGNILISDGTNYIASTSLWPNTVGAVGKILRSDGTTNAYTTSTFADTYTISQLLYAGSANTVSGLTIGNDGVLISSHTGVPSWLANPAAAGLYLQSGNGAPSSWSSYVPAASGANSDITSLTGLTGTISHPTGITSSAALNLMTFTYTATSVNYFAFTNAATGVDPIFAATGSDSNVNLELRVKDGYIALRNSASTLSATLRLYNKDNSHYTGFNVANAASTNATFTVPSADATSANQPLVSNASATLLFFNAPAASVNKSNTSMAANTFTKVTWQNETYDKGSYMTTTTYTPLVAGIYAFSACITFNATTAATRYGINIYKNGASIKFNFDTPAGVNGNTFPISGQCAMNGSTDTLEVYGWNNHATVAQALDNSVDGNFFDVVYICPST